MPRVEFVTLGIYHDESRAVMNYLLVKYIHIYICIYIFIIYVKENDCRNIGA